MSARRQRRTSIEHADVIEPQEPPGTHCGLRVLAIHPPGEIQNQLVKDPLQEGAVADSNPLLSRFCKRAKQPTRAPEDSHRRTPTRTPEAVRSDACTHSRTININCFFRELRID